MLKHDAALGHALCPGQLHVILIALIHHVAPQPHAVKCDII